MAKKKKTAAIPEQTAPMHADNSESVTDTPLAPDSSDKALDILAEIMGEETADAPDTASVASVTPDTAPAEETLPNEPTEPVIEATTDAAEPAPASADDSPLTAEPLSAEERASLLRDNAQLAFIGASKDNNLFVESLENVTADELGKPPKKKKKDPIDMIIGFVRQAIFWIAVVVFFVSGYQVVFKLYAYRQAADIYSFDFEAMSQRREDLVATALRDTRLSTLTPVNGTREESGELTDSADNIEFNEEFELAKGQMMILRNKNSEIVGWIRMDGDTEINYPIVQHEDNDYYLHYAYDGTYNPAGSIYLDYKNKVAMGQNRHSILYGHNMESGAPMFANLLHYREDGYWNDNRYIKIFTDDAFYTYEVFAAYETDPSQTKIENHSWRMNFKKDDNIFMGWLDAVRERSDISPDVKLDADSRILTLSTCMNINENRYVVHAVLVDTVN